MTMNGINDKSDILAMYGVDINNLTPSELAKLNDNLDLFLKEIQAAPPLSLHGLFQIGEKYGLTPPSSDAHFKDFVAVLTFGAEILAEIVDNNSLQNAINRVVAFTHGQLAVELTLEQAEEMRKQAYQAMITGIITGAITVGFGIASCATSGANSALANALGSVGSGFSKISESIGNYFVTLTQAGIKELEAEAEAARNARESVQKLAQALQEIINKAISTMESTAQSNNRTIIPA